MIDLKVAEVSASQERIKRIKTLLSTPAGTVPYDRAFGIDFSIVDMPINQAKVLLMAEIINKIRKYEPDITDISIDFISVSDRLIPKVVVK